MMDSMLEAFDESVQMERLTTGSKRKSLVKDPLENDDRTSTSTFTSLDGSASVEDAGTEVTLLKAEEIAYKAANKNSESVARMRKFIEEGADTEPLSKPMPSGSRWQADGDSCCSIS
jgi:hypothetical protein